MAYADETRRPDPSPLSIPVQRRRRIRSPNIRVIVIDHDNNHITGSEAIRTKWAPKPPCHGIMKYMVPSLLAVIALKNQSNSNSVFAEKSTSMWCFLVATCAYWLIAGIALQKQTTRDGKLNQISKDIALAMGVLAPVSLLSIFLPYRISIVPLLIWAPLPVALAWVMLYFLLMRARSRFIGLIKSMQAKLSMKKTSLPV